MRTSKAIVLVGCLSAASTTPALASETGAAPAEAGASAWSKVGVAFQPDPATRAPETAASVRTVVTNILNQPNAPYDPSARLFLASLDTGVPPTPADAASKGAEEPASTPAKASGEGLAVKLQNPVADLISVPIQFNWDTGIGPNDDKDKITVNIQPVIPFHLNKDWNLISRTIIPVIYAESPTPALDDAFGLGDTTQSFFFSPVKPIGGWILGVGPAALLPTGTDDLFRTKQFALGPTFVGLKQDKVGEGTLTYGILVNQLWKVAGSNEPDVQNVNSLYLQPFIGYTLKTGSTFTLNAESTYNWSDSEWSVPLNLMFSQLMAFGKQPIQLQFGGRYYVETVPNGPQWGIRFAITFLFPT